jgi:hypothetical protein
LKIQRRVATVAVAGAVSLAGLGAFAVTTQLGAAAASESATGTESASPTIGDRLTAIKDALKGLVTDGTTTQEQADRVATTLNESDALRRGRHGHGGHGGFGFHGGLALNAAAESLGITAQELRTELGEGKTLAEIAEAKGVEADALVDDLVAAATERIKQAVTNERLTQAQADELIAALPERIATAVEEGFGGRGFGLGGPGRHGGRDGFGPGQNEDAPQGTPQPSPTTSGASLTT